MLQIELNTRGGDMVIARSVASTLRHFGERHGLRIVVTGKCYSAGMTILMAAKPSNRYAMAGSEFLVHATYMAKTGRRNELTRGGDVQVQQALAAGTRINPRSLRRVLGSGEDCYFPAEDALRMGVIGAII